jgi:hypothetical protein
VAALEHSPLKEEAEATFDHPDASQNEIQRQLAFDCLPTLKRTQSAEDRLRGEWATHRFYAGSLLYSALPLNHCLLHRLRAAREVLHQWMKEHPEPGKQHPEGLLQGLLPDWTF